MNKPTKPSETLPSSFGGIKENFSSSKITNGYEPDVPDILGGANLNYLLDTLGKKVAYHDTIADYINDIPINKTPIVNSSNQLVYTQYDIRVYSATETYSVNDYVTGVVNNEKHIYKSVQNNNIGQSLTNDNYWVKTDIISDVETIGRNLGEIVISSIPLTDASLHLLDGSLLYGSGTYSDFVTYIASLRTNYSNLFTTESSWQSSVSQYGVCGKFVYNGTNNTVRLPKYSDKIYTQELDATAPVVGNGITLGITNGTLNAGLIYNPNNNIGADFNQGVYGSPVYSFPGGSTLNGMQSVGVTTDPTKSGLAVLLSDITTSLDSYYYIVIATSTKTDIEVDIDEIATDLNGKADKDFSNVDDDGSSRGASWAFPSETYTNLTLGASGATYTAPANGWVQVTQAFSSSGATLVIAVVGTNQDIVCMDSHANSTNISINAFIPVSKGQTFKVNYTGTLASSQWNRFQFIYAQGSESEGS